MKQLLVLSVLMLTGCAGADCIKTSCNLTINFPYDATGTPDARPGTWGKAGFNDGKVTFKNVPAGYRVRIERVYGDFVGWIRGAPSNVAEDVFAGALFGLITTASKDTPFATYAQDGCMVYLQSPVSVTRPTRAPFDLNVHNAGLLEADNILIVRRAVFLNETGGSLHMEPSFVVEFKYEEIK